MKAPRLTSVVFDWLFSAIASSQTFVIRSTMREALVALIVVNLLCSCGRAMRDYEEAQQANTIEAYETFLHNNPRSAFAVQASNKVAGLREDKAWLQTTNRPSIQTLQQFANTYPNSAHSAEARVTLTNLMMAEWEAIRIRFSEQDYTDFLALEPPTILAQEAKFMVQVCQSAKSRGISGLRVVDAEVLHFEDSTNAPAILGMPSGKYSFGFAGPPGRYGDINAAFVYAELNAYKRDFLTVESGYRPRSHVELVIGTVAGAFGPEQKVVALLKSK